MGWMPRQLNIIARLGRRPLCVPISSLGPIVINMLLKCCNCGCRDDGVWKRVPKINDSVREKVMPNK